jgi:hypothetical protein
MSSQESSIPFLFFPGHKQEFETGKGHYDDLMDVFAKIDAPGAQVVPVFVQPKWEEDTPADWMSRMYDAAISEARACASGTVLLGGFSFGSIPALGTAARLKQNPSGPQPVGVMAASYSPYLRESFPVRAALTNDLGIGVPDETRRQLRAKSMRTAELLADCNAQLYIGGAEHRSMYVQFGMAILALPNAQPVIAPGADHNILHPSYLQTVAANVGNLLLEPTLFREQIEATRNPL